MLNTRKGLLGQGQRQQDDSDVPLRLLNNSGIQLVIYFRGNAGTVGQTSRNDSYRMIKTSKRAHVLAFDYREFGTLSSSLLKQD